ncbi:PilN domain-containing protein [Granulicella cerasi]|uniref:PilN domain-containing protein n=1 Tax=Granulicella cerasi TaxID=741063 RepID=A0ABW1ZBI1_9BACT|nr:PilN domain-containing protein [Granulicella cerasi]
MKVQVNLATRPFVELRPFFLRLRIVMGALGVLVIALGIWAHVQSKKLQRAEQQIAAVQASTNKVQSEKVAAENRMKLPQNAAVLDRAHFLNQLFLRKSFSWTAVMMDLETVLPTGVQVTAIEPQVSQEGDVIIRLRVAGDRDRAVLLVRNLERSKRFLQPRLSGEATQSKEAGRSGAPVNPAVPAGVEFDILANYNPLPTNEPFRFTKAKTDSSTPGVTDVPVAAGHGPTRHVGNHRDGIVLKPFVPPARPVQGGAR